MNAREVLNQTRDAMTARRVYAEPYKEDGVTVIPAANVIGGGGGGGDTEGNGGGGLGRAARPAGGLGLQKRRSPPGPPPHVQPRVFLVAARRGLWAVVPATARAARDDRGLGRT